MPRDPERELEELFVSYVDRLNGGEELDAATILSENPTLGGEVLAYLEDYLSMVSGANGDSNDDLGVLGDYTLRRQIGRGGMGVVYEGWQASMERVVALKVLPPGVASDSRAFHRFMREAKTAGQLSHPNIVSVYSTGVEEGTPWYSMEYVEGETLARILGRTRDADPESATPFGKKDCVEYFARLADAFDDVADGLQHAHSKGVVHRDIKPSNLILDPQGQLRILDFGLARLEGQESLTLSGGFVGTPLYMSPEQARRKQITVDHRSDVYSLGATMYEAFCGQPPFRGRDHADTLSQIIEKDPVAPRARNPSIPSDLETIVLKCLRKSADDRYGTAEALGQDLRRFVRGDAVEARAPTMWELTAKRLWRQRRLALAAGILLILALVGLSVSSAYIARARDRAEYDFYVSSMRLAPRVWESGNYSRFVELLESHLPGRRGSDIRGWEWFYLNGLRDQGLVPLDTHAKVVNDLAWSPGRDRLLLASASADGTIKIRNLRSTEPPQILEVGKAVLKVVWSPDASRIAAVEVDGTVSIWEIRRGLRVLSIGASGSYRCIAWSPDGTRLALGAIPGRACIVDATTGAELRELLAPDPGIQDLWVRAISWSPDGRWVVAALRRRELGPLLVWDASDLRQPPIELEGHRRYGLSLAWRADGGALASCGVSHDVKFWAVPAWKQSPVVLAHAGPVSSVAWSADGTRIASGGNDGKVELWDPETGSALHTLVSPPGQVRSVAWSSGGEYLAFSGADGAVYLWEPTGREVGLDSRAAARAAWSQDGRWLVTKYAANQERLVDRVSTFAVLDAKSEDLVATRSFPGFGARCLRFSPDSRRIASSWRDGTLRIWNWQGDGSVCVVQAHEKEARSVDFSPDGRLLATGGRGGVKVWTTSGELIVEFPRKGAVKSVAWSPAGDRLAAAGFGVWETSNWRRLEAMRFHEEDPEQLPWSTIDWSPSGDRLAWGTGEGDLVIFDSSSGRVVSETQAHTALVRDLAWSPDGRRLASSSEDHTVRIWNVERGRDLEELITVGGYAGNVLCVAWHPEGERLVTADPFSVRILDAPGYGDHSGAR